MDNKKFVKIYPFLVLAGTALVTLLRSLALAQGYDAAIGYFNKAPIALILNIITLLTVISCALPLVLMGKGTITAKFTENAPVLRLASCYSAIITLISVVEMLHLFSQGLLEKTAVIFTAISALFFIFSAMSKRNLDIYKAFLSVSVVVCCACILASLYFNLNIAMNSPHKAYGSFALMSAMILMLCEVRIYLDKPLPRLHLTLSALTFILGFSQAASAIIYRLTSSPDEFEANSVLLGSLGYVLFIAAISFFAIARCFTFSTVTPAEDEPQL